MHRTPGGERGLHTQRTPRRVMDHGHGPGRADMNVACRQLDSDCRKVSLVSVRARPLSWDMDPSGLMRSGRGSGNIERLARSGRAGGVLAEEGGI